LLEPPAFLEKPFRAPAAHARRLLVSCIEHIFGILQPDVRGFMGGFILKYSGNS
jgi:hypothetical protein